MRPDDDAGPPPTRREVERLRGDFAGPGEVNRIGRLICDLARQGLHESQPPAPGLFRRARSMMRAALGPRRRRYYD